MIVAAPVLSANILAKIYVIADSNGTVIEQQNMYQIQPIASITKLMTAMVVLDSGENLNHTFRMKKFRGTYVTRKQLLDLAIIHSDNEAADMLCQIYIRGYRGCIEDMNKKAEDLGMMDTIYFDSTGRDNRNMSTGLDLIKLLRAAEHYPIITHASTQTHVGVTVPQLIKTKKHKKRKVERKLVTTHVEFANTNPLVAKYDIVVSKTGYIKASGGCLAMSAIVNGTKKYFIILNSKTTKTRILDMEKLINRT